MNVRWNSNALRELTETLAYVGEHDARAASAFAARVEAACRLIADYPYAGGDTRLPHVRRLVIGRYILVYELKAGEAIISYLRHGARKRPWADK